MKKISILKLINFSPGKTLGPVRFSHNYSYTHSLSKCLKAVIVVLGFVFTLSSITGITYAASVANDAFTRSVSSGWGTADTGGNWSNSGGVAGDFNVNGSEATMAITSANSNRYESLFSVSSTENDVTFKFKTDKLPEGGGQYLMTRARTTLGGDYYYGQIGMTTTSAFQLTLRKFVSSTDSAIGSTVDIPDMAVVADQYYQVRFQTTGTSPTTIRMKIWRDGGKEPTYWQIEGTDSSASVQGAGYPTLRGYLSSSATNAPVTYTFDDFDIDNSPTNPTAPGLTGSNNTKGVNWHIGPWYNTVHDPGTYYVDGLYTDLDHMKSGDINWIRHSFNIATQTTCGDTSLYSKIIDATSSRQMNVLGLISIPNPTTTTATSGERSAFTTWLSTMVNCYKDDVDYWEIHNEPNLHYFWNIDEDTVNDAEYAQSVEYYLLYLQDAYNTIKGIDPSATVVFGGLAQSKWERFMNVVIDTFPSYSNYFDAIAFHPYSDNDANGVLNLLNAFYSKLQSNASFADKTIWITEVGYTSNASQYPGNTGGSDSVKASRLGDMYQKLLDWGITTPIFWYDYAQDDSTGTYGYELENTDRTRLTSTYSDAYGTLRDLWLSASSDTPANILANTGTEGATITWTTTDLRSTQVEYGPTTAYGTTTTEVDISPKATNHSVTISGLTSCTSYFYRVKSVDYFGNTITSNAQPLTTTGCSITQAAPPVCAQTPPEKPPWLYSAIAQNYNSIKLYFTKAGDPADHYALEYGTEPGNYKWGADNIGSGNTTNYLVRFLSPNKTYYFRVRAGNGCAAGSWSNELSASTSTYTAVSTQTAIEVNPLNKPKSNEISLQAQESATKTDSGYIINVSIKDQEQKPVVGAKVTIHSKVQEAVTNSIGVVKFENVEPGDHKVLVAYDSYEGEHDLNLSGSVKEQNINITIEKKTILSPTAIAIIGGLSFAVIVLLVILLTKRNKV